MKAKIEGRYIVIPTPNKDSWDGLEVLFKPSGYWLRKNKTLEPEMTTSIFKGQSRYKLPHYFRVDSIIKIIIKD